MAITLEDIAKKVGVSKAAVSLALNGKPGVSDRTRRRILRVAEELGYLPCAMVKLEQYYGHSKTIRFLACIWSDVVSERYQVAPFFMEMIHGLEHKARELGYALVFSAVQVNNLPSEVDSLEAEHPSDGIILLGTNLSADEVSIVRQRQPNVVVIDANFELLNLNCVVMNNTMGGYQAANHLLELGHKNLGYVQSTTRISNFKLRWRGFSAALEEKGVKLQEENLFSLTPVSEIAAAEFKKDIASRTEPLPTALFCENDYLAIGVVKALIASGRRVPEDVSVVGFDDISQAMILEPQLSTVHVDKTSMGELAVQRLAEIIEDRDLPAIKIIVDTRLVKRRSTALANEQEPESPGDRQTLLA